MAAAGAAAAAGAWAAAGAAAAAAGSEEEGCSAAGRTTGFCSSGSLEACTATAARRRVVRCREESMWDAPLRQKAEGRQGWQAQGACRCRQRWAAAAAHQPAGARTTPDAPLGWRSGRRGSLQRWGRQGRRDSVRTIRPRQNHQPTGPAPRHKQLTGAAECQAHGARGCKRCEGGQRRAREC